MTTTTTKTFTRRTATGATVHAITSGEGEANDLLITACGQNHWRVAPLHEDDYPGFPDGHYVGVATVTCRRCAQIAARW